MTAEQVLEQARKQKPGVRFARYRSGSAIGAWDDAQGRFVPVAEATLDGRWCRMPFEVLVNGQSLYDPDDWVE